MQTLKKSFQKKRLLPGPKRASLPYPQPPTHPPPPSYVISPPTIFLRRLLSPTYAARLGRLGCSNYCSPLYRVSISKACPRRFPPLLRHYSKLYRGSSIFYATIAEKDPQSSIQFLQISIPEDIEEEDFQAVFDDFFWGMGKFYAVRKGHSPGLYTTWAECLQQVKGFKGATCKRIPPFAVWML